MYHNRILSKVRLAGCSYPTADHSDVIQGRHRRGGWELTSAARWRARTPTAAKSAITKAPMMPITTESARETASLGTRSP
jgi:hypothetical protein